VIVRIELFAGPGRGEPTKADVQKNIDVLDRYKRGRPECADDILLGDVIEIFRKIQKQMLH
jgi:hypothetical protein